MAIFGGAPVCGGSSGVKGEFSDAPKTINSKEITYFAVSCSFATMGSDRAYTYVSSLAVPAGRGTLVSLTYSTQSRFSGGGNDYCETRLVTGDVFVELQAIVDRHDFAKKNGESYHVAGLPDNFGGSATIEYASGEKITMSNNQSPIIAPAAGAEIVDLLKGRIENDAVGDLSVGDIVKIVYNEFYEEGHYTTYELTEEKLYSECQFKKGDEVYTHENYCEAGLMDKARNLVDKSAALYWDGIAEKETWHMSTESLTFVMKDGREIKVNGFMRCPNGVIFNIKMLMFELSQRKDLLVSEDDGKTECPVCKARVKKANFCTACGASLLPQKPVRPDLIGVESTHSAMPGENGRGAIYTCGICGKQYANTGVGCPFCKK